MEGGEGAWRQVNGEGRGWRWWGCIGGGKGGGTAWGGWWGHSAGYVMTRQSPVTRTPLRSWESAFLPAERMDGNVSLLEVIFPLM